MLRGDVAGLERRSGERVGRRDHADPSLARCGERLPCVLRKQKGRGQQEREQAIPLLLGERCDRRDVLEAGVRHQRVDPTVPFEGAVDHVTIAGDSGQIGIVDVNAFNQPAIRRETRDDRRSDSAPRAGDECDLRHYS